MTWTFLWTFLLNWTNTSMPLKANVLRLLFLYLSSPPSGVVYCFRVCSCPCGCQHSSVDRTNKGENINIHLDLAATVGQVTKEEKKMEHSVNKCVYQLWQPSWLSLKNSVEVYHWCSNETTLPLCCLITRMYSCFAVSQLIWRKCW